MCTYEISHVRDLLEKSAVRICTIRERKKEREALKNTYKYFLKK